LNSLLKHSEITAVKEYMEPFYRAGLDGVIVQDVGVANVLRREFPDLPLHGSTQMSISSAWGAELLKNEGFTRVVPARELSLDEIRAIRAKVDIEIETFVHGAMCFAYSGKCLMSSFIGGRSGNRGRCAQPCRQCWKAGRMEGYALSMKDMCLLGELPRLIESGIDSFKIEGRMKKPEYVAATVHAYRRAVDMYAEGSWDEEEIARLITDMKDIYNRGGFSTGYYFRENSADMICADRPNHSGVPVGTVKKISQPDIFVRLQTEVYPQDVLEIRSPDGKGDAVELTAAEGEGAGGLLRLKGKDFRKIQKGMPVFRMRCNRLIDRIQKELIEPERFVTADAAVTAKTGEPLQIEITGGGVSVTVLGNTVGPAQNRAADAGVISEKMQKTGGSGVRLRVNCDISGDAFVPMSELNAMRRQAVNDFREALSARRCRPDPAGEQCSGRTEEEQKP